jgi:hypothetical protein
VLLLELLAKTGVAKTLILRDLEVKIRQQRTYTENIETKEVVCGFSRALRAVFQVPSSLLQG